MSDKVALVFGASGVSGWAVVDQLLSYPTSTTFTRVIALTFRPLSIEQSFWPRDDRLEVYSGVNLRDDLGAVKEQLRTAVPRIEDVTHVYYNAYSNSTAYSVDVMEIRDINVAMTGSAVRAVDELCARLEFLVLQTGTNHYGVAVFGHQDKIQLAPPLRESQPRVPSPYGDEIFYYAQVDLIKDLQHGKSWKWCEVRPDIITGFVPNTSSMSYLEPLALFFSLWRHVHGPGAEIRFFGTAANYVYTNTESSQDIIARSEIYLSVVRPDAARGEAFNTADCDRPVSWVTRWPALVGYFGLEGVGPEADQDTVTPIDKWWHEHQEDVSCPEQPAEPSARRATNKPQYEQMCAEYGLERRQIPAEAWIFILVAGFDLLKRDRALCLDKIRSVGFTEEFPLCGGHLKSLERLVASKRIPPLETLQKGAKSA